MGCPTQCVLGENLTFTIQARTGSGAASDATGTVSYSIYEDETSTAILTGSMAQLSSQTGFYSEQIACTVANGFERFKSYTARITATVATVAVAKAYTFLCLGGEDTTTATTGALTTLAKFQSYTGVSTDDDLITSLIARATSEIERYCDRTLNSTTYRELYDGDGTKELRLDQYPITAVTLLSVGVTDAFGVMNESNDAYSAYITTTSTTMTLTIDGGTNDGSDSLTIADYTVGTLITAINALGKSWTATAQSTVKSLWNADEILIASGLNCLNGYCYPQIPDDPADNFVIVNNEGSLKLRNDIFVNGTQNVVVRYTAGYSTIPAGLEQICIDLTNIYYNSKATDPTLRSEKLGDHTVTFYQGSRGLPDSIKKRLASFKRWRV